MRSDTLKHALDTLRIDKHINLGQKHCSSSATHLDFHLEQPRQRCWQPWKPARTTFENWKKHWTLFQNNDCKLGPYPYDKKLLAPIAISIKQWSEENQTVLRNAVGSSNGALSAENDALKLYNKKYMILLSSALKINCFGQWKHLELIGKRRKVIWKIVLKTWCEGLASPVDLKRSFESLAWKVHCKAWVRKLTWKGHLKGWLEKFIVKLGAEP